MRDAFFDPQFRGNVRSDSLILPYDKSKTGIQVNHNSPAYTWRDLEGEIRPRETGAGKPTYAVFRGLQKAYHFAAGDVCDLVYHWPHDWVVGSPVYIHTHWSHNGTAISGTLTLKYVWSFAKGHGQSVFPADSTLTHTLSIASVSERPQYGHEIDEIAWAVEGTPGTGEISVDDLEPDGLLLVSLEADVIPTITGGTVANPFIMYADLHYLSTNVGTLNRAPNFWLPS